MASTYLQRTISSAGSNTISTLSVWVKLGNLGTARNIYSVSSGSTSVKVWFDTSNQLVLNAYEGGVTLNKITSRVFRDTNSFYHILVRYDTTDGTAEDRVQLYVNGTRETSFGTNTNPSASLDINLNENAFNQRVGADQVPGDYFDGSMAHFHWIDGTAYDASAFGETDSTTGEWKPITGPSVTYGTNGFFLKFENASSFGEDSSGNNNDFTSNGSPTQLVDTPANILATMNAVDNSSVTLSNGNLTCSCASPSGIRSTLAVSKGKWYAEVKYTNTASFCGVVAMEQLVTTVSTSSVTLFGGSSGQPELFLNGSAQSDYSSAGTLSAGDIIQIALDKDNNNVYFGKNGSWFGGTNWTESSPTTAHALSSGSSYVHGFRASTGSGTSVNSWNFGNGYFGTTAVTSGNQDDAGYGTFEYDVPTGYYTLNTKNINTYG